MATLRYVNDLGNGHSGYIVPVDPIEVTLTSGIVVNAKVGGDTGTDA